MHSRRTIAWLVAAAVAVTLVPVASASASDDGASAARTRRQAASERKQNRRIQGLLEATAKLTTDVADLTTKVGNLDQKIDGVDTRLKAIEGAAPQIISGLSQLKDGLEKAGAGLTSLKTLATSQEYGFGQLLTSTGGPPTAELGSFVVTPDIPDSVQQAQTTQQFVAQHNGVLIVLFGVRSFESDGTGASDPAAFCKVTVTNEAGQTQTTDPNPNLGGVPFQPVPDKSAPTSTTTANQGFPFGLKQDNTNNDADHTVTFASSVAVATGDTYTVGLSCVDTSASATEPSA